MLYGYGYSSKFGNEHLSQATPNSSATMAILDISFLFLQKFKIKVESLSICHQWFWLILQEDLL